ncbi:hypothetical protein E1B28_008130 [Marasmius oreades]|uniref:Uncharacterized protein n=1 Tax=Marasmius oreades TaxID=181124 RepID=A0A9P7UTZ5_9AGAR|nr:uncharacterized protein E1B28_008130 [Marasmius oreades]KAG7091729.1 hypothetical protein E1B28_008130 [Marasmius oreades]
MANLHSYHDEAGKSSSQTSLTQFICERKFRRGAVIRNRVFESSDMNEEAITYDEFCSRLGGASNQQTEAHMAVERDDEDSSRDMKTHSYVQRWRKNINFRVEIGPPVSPLIATEFPSSPVAVIHPSSLRMSWTPNYDVARMAMTSSPELASPSMVDKPTRFYDLYDAELEQLIDEASESQSSSGTSDSDTISVYVPPAATTSTRPQSKQKALKSAMRWLPKRIKYTFLSTAAGRSLRR